MLLFAAIGVLCANAAFVHGETVAEVPVFDFPVNAVLDLREPLNDRVLNPRLSLTPDLQRGHLELLRKRILGDAQLRSSIGRDERIFVHTDWDAHFASALGRSGQSARTAVFRRDEEEPPWMNRVLDARRARAIADAVEAHNGESASKELREFWMEYTRPDRGVVDLSLAGLASQLDDARSMLERHHIAGVKSIEVNKDISRYPVIIVKCRKAYFHSEILSILVRSVVPPDLSRFVFFEEVP